MTGRRKRLAAARTLGLSGLVLSLLLVVGVWAGSVLALVPLQAALSTVSGQLTTLDAQLAQVQAAVMPLDALVRPEAQGAVKTLGELARTAGRTPLLGTVFGADNLRSATELTAQWETALEGHLPLAGTLDDTRRQVQGWQVRLTQLLQGLRLAVFGMAGGITLLVGWFAAGQWALYRLASGAMRERGVREGV